MGNRVNSQVSGNQILQEHAGFIIALITVVWCNSRFPWEDVVGCSELFPSWQGSEAGTILDPMVIMFL